MTYEAKLPLAVKGHHGQQRQTTLTASSRKLSEILSAQTWLTFDYAINTEDHKVMVSSGRRIIVSTLLSPNAIASANAQPAAIKLRLND